MRELVGALNELAGTDGKDAAGAANSIARRFAGYPAHSYQPTDVDITLGDVNRIVGCTSANITVTVPAAAAGSWLVVKDESGDAGSLGAAIAVTPTSGTVDGAANLMLDQDYEAVFMYSNGTDWFTAAAIGSVL